MTPRVLPLAMIGACLMAAPALAQNDSGIGAASFADPPAVAPSLRPAAALRPGAGRPPPQTGPAITTGSGRSFSRIGTTITTGAGRTVTIGPLQGPAAGRR